jgi:molybdenum cofactor guanylyltransferase
MAISPPLFGILIGGQGSRMGGVPKGLLRRASGETILEHLTALCREVSPSSSLVLLGTHAAYAATPLETLPDVPEGIGPLGGLAALLHAATQGTPRQPDLRAEQAVILGCDQPYLSVSLLRRLVTHASNRAVCVQLDGHWNPVFARYPASNALAVVLSQIAKGSPSMQPLLKRLQAEALPLSESDRNALRDWDRVEDMLNQ